MALPRQRVAGHRLERAPGGIRTPGPSQVYVTLFNADLYAETLALAGRLRQAGINAEQSLKPVRLGKQIRYADRKGIPFVAILGTDELAEGKLVLKNLSTGEQQTYAEVEAIERLKTG